MFQNVLDSRVPSLDGLLMHCVQCVSNRGHGFGFEGFEQCLDTLLESCHGHCIRFGFVIRMQDCDDWLDGLIQFSLNEFIEDEPCNGNVLCNVP